MQTSLFDLFKIGIGPSSSHTVGPMRAAWRFTRALPEGTARVRTDLYGSLALTGRGHGTPRGVALGLAGNQPDTVDPLAAVKIDSFDFDIERDVVFHPNEVLPGHSNGMRFTALDAAGQVLRTGVYYSVGGGFVVEEGAPSGTADLAAVPYPFTSGADLLELGAVHGLRIHEMMFANERAWRSEEEIRGGIRRIWAVMQECTRRGLATEGILPGGLNVQRRAPARLRKLEASRSPDPLSLMDWLNVFAMAVNEENAAGGRVVTAPTNGAAGIIPAVAHYYMRFMGGGEAGLERYFLSAAAIGVLYKENASISGAEVGCQGEVGVACSMAAAGLAAALDGANEQVEHAAEIGMEHNLGMTCDPIGGLVQIPCIERNAFGAVKAVNAARMALEDTGSHKVSLDQVIRTMYQTGLDMQSHYKETSLAGLAVNVIEC
ncbi:MAG TPA: L-serine ammonia-lyase [Candidatus Sulfopaludibacter sp.]|jgi:L-serine dehydratase|nr:L-serine ammonia-lyase [Candidatus Sulfopaludibacter sp.]